MAVGAAQGAGQAVAVEGHEGPLPPEFLLRLHGEGYYEVLRRANGPLFNVEGGYKRRRDKSVDVSAIVCHSRDVKKKAATTERITVRLPRKTREKLDRIANKLAPRGTRPTSAAAIRNLIEEKNA